MGDHRQQNTDDQISTVVAAKLPKSLRQDEKVKELLVIVSKMAGFKRLFQQQIQQLLNCCNFQVQNSLSSHRQFSN